MHSSFRLDVIVFLASLALACGVAPAAAQSLSITGLATKTSLTDAEKREVSRWVRNWAADLASEDADRSRTAKRRLLEPMNEPGVKPIFRLEYGLIVVEEMGKFVSGDSAFASINTLQVMAEVGSDACLNVMRERLDPQTEQRETVRLWAVHGVNTIRAIGVATQRNVDAAIRDMMRAAEHETSWLVLWRQFETLAAAGNDQARDFQIELFRITLNKVEADAERGAPLMQTVHRAIHVMFQQWLAMNVNDQRRFGTAIAPQLERVLGIVLKQWDAARQVREPVKSSYDGAVRQSEQLLRFIDEQVRGRNLPPERVIERAWSEGNRDAFEQAIGHWQTVLREPPYTARR